MTVSKKFGRRGTTQKKAYNIQNTAKYFDITLRSMPRSFKWSLSYSSPQQNPLRTSPVSHTCQMPHPFHSSSFDHSNNILWGIQSIRGSVKWFVISCLRLGVVSTSPNPQAGGPPLVGCPRLLIRYIRSYPPYQGPVPLHATWGRAMLWRQGLVYHGAIDNEQ